MDVRAPTALHLTWGDRPPEGFFDGARARILELQRDNGAIPWFDHGVFDPWNHTEAAMGLTILGEIGAARRAYQHLMETQLEDGSWWGELGSAVPLDDEKQKYTGGDEGAGEPIRDTNMSAYIATGALHFYRVTSDMEFLKLVWPHVRAAMEFVVSLQKPEGDIRWAPADSRASEDDALVTGCSSIHKSLEHAAEIAALMGEPRPDWLEARDRLGEALRDKPHRFDRTWDSKSRFSMDWFYPVLGGAYTGERARARLAERWDEFVKPGIGCRCVLEQPWATVAEAAELSMALIACGQRPMGEQMLAWQHQWRAEDGAYWMGYQFESEVPWPDEKPAWTAGAVILATDAVCGLTPAATILTSERVSEPA